MFWEACLGDLATVQDREVVGCRQCFILVMGDQYRSGPGAAKEVDDLGSQCGSQAGVQGGERLVEQHELGPDGEGSREGNALTLATGQLVGSTVAQAVQPDQGDHPLDLLSAFGAGNTEADVPGNAEVREQACVLRDIPDPSTTGGDKSAGSIDLPTGQVDGAGVDGFEACQDA